VKPIFRSAITDAQGDVDVGYLALIWGLIGWGVSVGVVLTVGAFTAWRTPKDGAGIIQAMGIAVGTVSGGFATMLGAVGLFRFGDKERPALPGSTTTKTVETKVTEAAAPAEPIAVEVTNVQPVPVIETKRKTRKTQ